MPKTDVDKVNINVYYKPKRLASSFSRRPKSSDLMSHGVVYEFNCKEDDCNASYVGYTTIIISASAILSSLKLLLRYKMEKLSEMSVGLPQSWSLRKCMWILLPEYLC